MIQGVPKKLELVSYKNSTYLHVLIKVYDLHLLEGSVFDLAKYVMQVCLNFVPTQNSTQKPLVVEYEKEGRFKCLGEVSYTLSDWENHLRNLHLFHQIHKTSR